MAWPVDMSLTSGGTSSEPKEKSLPEFDASEALEMVFSRAAACLSWSNREPASRDGQPRHVLQLSGRCLASLDGSLAENEFRGTGRPTPTSTTQ